MASNRQIAANRRNARKSTGPRTKAGKTRARGNAYRHGLRSRRLSTQLHAKEIEDLALELAGDNRSRIVLECARTAAEASLELVRTRRTRLALIEQMEVLEDGSAQPALNSATELRLLYKWLDERAAATRNVSASQEPDRAAEVVRRVLPELKLLARYERGTWSRREKALRALKLCFFA